MNVVSIDAERCERVVVDIGCGDGRHVYRLAKANPTWLCVGVDANGAVMATIAYRASRKASRGGVPNAAFVRASLDELPGPLEGIADEVQVNLPWGSLLDAVLGRDERGLAAVAAVGKPGATLRVAINASALEAAGVPP